MTRQRSPATWRFFDFLGRRVLAVLLAVAGSIGSLMSLLELIDWSASIPVEGQAEPDSFYLIVLFLLSVTLAVAGVLMYRAPPYGPPRDGPDMGQNQ